MIPHNPESANTLPSWSFNAGREILDSSVVQCSSNTWPKKRAAFHTDEVRDHCQLVPFPFSEMPIYHNGPYMANQSDSGNYLTVDSSPWLPLSAYKTNGLVYGRGIGITCNYSKIPWESGNGQLLNDSSAHSGNEAYNLDRRWRPSTQMLRSVSSFHNAQDLNMADKYDSSDHHLSNRDDTPQHNREDVLRKAEIHQCTICFKQLKKASHLKVT